MFRIGQLVPKEGSAGLEALRSWFRRDSSLETVANSVTQGHRHRGAALSKGREDSKSLLSVKGRLRSEAWNEGVFRFQLQKDFEYLSSGFQTVFHKVLEFQGSVPGTSQAVGGGGLAPPSSA